MLTLSSCPGEFPGIVVLLLMTVVQQLTIILAQMDPRYKQPKVIAKAIHWYIFSLQFILKLAFQQLLLHITCISWYQHLAQSLKLRSG